MLKSSWNGATTLAIALLLSCGAAQASTVTVTERSYQNYVYYTGGMAIESADGSDGAGSGNVPQTLSGLSPANVGISGSDYHQGTRYDWNYAVDWNVQQGYSASGNVLNAYGSIDLNIVPNATAGITAWNMQQIEFVVGGSTGLALTGHTTAAIGATPDQNSARQTFVLQQWNSSASIWVTVYQNYLDDDFTYAGALADGRYQISNRPYPVTADGVPLVQSSDWDWTLTFADAEVSAQLTTPLPGSLWLMGTGLAGLFGVSRRRSRLQRRSRSDRGHSRAGA